MQPAESLGAEEPAPELCEVGNERYRKLKQKLEKRHRQLDKVKQGKLLKKLADAVDVLTGRKPCVSPQSVTERQRIWAKQRDWATDVADYFTLRGWNNLQTVELRALAMAIGQKLGIHLDREDKRRKLLLKSWFVTHWDRIRDEIDNFSGCDDIGEFEANP